MDCWNVIQLLALLNTVLLTSAYSWHTHAPDPSCEDHDPRADPRIDNDNSSGDESGSGSSEEVSRGRTGADIRVMNRRGVGGQNRTWIASLAKLVQEGPDKVNFPTSQSFIPKNVPEECKRTGICEDLMEYPEHHVNQLVEQLGDAIEQFKSDEMLPVIASRYGAPGEEKLCKVIEKVAIPKAAPDKDGTWRYIVNQKEALQGVRVEICLDSDLSRYVSPNLGYQIGCKQEFMIRYLYTLDARGKMVQTAMQLPSCCACVVRDN